MVSDFKSIPILDISPLLKKWDDSESMVSDPDVSQVIKQLDEACKQAGFFYVKGHGIPDSLVQEVRQITHKFFDLPYDEKVKIKMSAMTGYRGYQRIGENITKGKPDMHEAIYCYKEFEPGMYGDLGKVLEGPNKWPSNPSNYKSTMEEYISLLTDLSKVIMRGVALALGGSPDEFGGERAGDPFWVMRLIGYPGISDSKGPGILENDVGWILYECWFFVFGFNCINKSVKHTQIMDDEIPALQVRNRSDEWIWAVPIPGTFVCNIGDMLKIWSNGLYESTLHRVINNSIKYRVSVAFFYEPNFDAVIEPLDFCKQKVGGIEKCERAVYGEHLVRKVLTNFAE